MTLEEIKQSDWYKERPSVIQEAINKLPPTTLYKSKATGKQCYIVAYTEPDEECSEVTLTVQKTGIGGAFADAGFGALDRNAVFGLKLDDLEVWED